MTGVRRASTEAVFRREARRLFNDKGYHGMTLRAVAAGAGIEAQSLYNYTRSKQDLVISLMREVTIAVQAAVDAAIAQADRNPVDMLHAAMAAHTKFHTDRDRVMIVRDGMAHIGSDGRSDLMVLVRKYETTFIEIIRAGVSTGVFRPVDATPVAFALLGMGQSVATWYTRGDRLTPDELSLMYADLAVNGLRSPAAGAVAG